MKRVNKTMGNQLGNKIIGKNLNGRYRVISALGTGGFGTTYLAEDQHRPGRPRCVVKQLQLNSNNAQLIEVTRRLFNTEAETLQRISHHKQIPELLASFEEEGQFFLVQEFIPGPSLISEILSAQVLSEPRVTNLLKDILNVLEFIHTQGVVHRNLKPDNLIHHEQLDKWILISFGSEKALKEISTQLMGQKRGMAVAFKPPTRPSKEPTPDSPSASSDIYALGMICLQALTGLPPSEIERDPKTGEIRWSAEIMSQVSPKLRNIISKMVFHDSSQRYSSATEVLQALDTSPAFPLPKRSNPPQSVQTAESPPQAPKSPKPIDSPFNPSSRNETVLPFSNVPKAPSSPRVTDLDRAVESPLQASKSPKSIDPPFNPSLKDETVPPFSNVPKTPSSQRVPEPDRAEASDMNSVFAQPVVLDATDSPLPLWLSGLGTVATLLAAGFVFWIILKADTNNTVVTSKPPNQEVSLDAEQRALLQEANSPIKSQARSKASSQKQNSPEASKIPTPQMKAEVPVPVPPSPQMKIPTTQIPPTKPQPKTSINEALAKSEQNSATLKQNPTKANPSAPSVKNEVSAKTKTEAATAPAMAQGSEPVSTPTPPKAEEKATLEAKPTPGNTDNSSIPNPGPVAKNSQQTNKAETPSPLPTVSPNLGPASPQQAPSTDGNSQPVAKKSLSNSRVDISLVNATGTVVSYQVLGNTDERSLYADMRSNLRGLPAPANVSFYRPDRGPIEIITKTIAPGKIQVTLKRGSGTDNDHSFLTVQDSGKITLD